MSSVSESTFAGRSIWCRSSSGRWHSTHSADGTTAAHLTTAADHPWTCHHSPFRVSRTSHMSSRAGSASASPLGSTSTAVCCASSTSNSSPAVNGRGSSYAACSSHGNSRQLAPATGRARLTLPESVNFCSCASSTCAIASKSHRIAYGTWTRQLCAWFQQADAWMDPRGAEPAHVFASRAFVTVTLAANMRGRRVDADRLRGEERPSAPSLTTLSAPARVSLPDALDHAGRSLGHDRRDRRGHARTPW